MAIEEGKKAPPFTLEDASGAEGFAVRFRRAST